MLNTLRKFLLLNCSKEDRTDCDRLGRTPGHSSIIGGAIHSESLLRHSGHWFGIDCEHNHERDWRRQRDQRDDEFDRGI